MCPTTSDSIQRGRIEGSWRAHELNADDLIRRGLRSIRTTCDGDGRWQHVVWIRDPYAVSDEDDRKITCLSDGGVSVMLSLGLWTPSPEHARPRFKTAAEIEQYMNFVQLSSRHFKGRVACYEIWNQPDADTPGWHVDLGDYLDLARVTTPVVREEDPDAKVAVGATRSPADQRARDYLLGICTSDVMTLVDVVTWHGAHDVEPAVEQAIVHTAAEHGFRGAVMTVPPELRRAEPTANGQDR